MTAPPQKGRIRRRVAREPVGIVSIFVSIFIWAADHYEVPAELVAPLTGLLVMVVRQYVSPLLREDDP